jgi:hypothetical protein
MKVYIGTVLAAGLLLASAAGRADDSTKKAGQAVGHETGSIGHGLSKVYHEAAKGTHKIIAKNTHDPHRRAYHMRKAAAHRHDSHQQTRWSRKERHAAARAAKKM